MSISNLTPQQLRQAADLQEKIASLNKQLEHILDLGTAIPAPLKAAKGDFVENNQGFARWSEPPGFRADIFLKQIYRRLKNRSA